MGEVALLTQSRMGCFRSCPRKHWMRYELGLRPAEESLPIRIGHQFHAGLEAQSRGEAFVCALEDEYQRALVLAMLEAHRDWWSGLGSVDSPLRPAEILAVELPFEIPVVNPETGAPTPIWRQAGKMDKIVRLADGRVALWEIKTTSRDFSPGADYWVALHLDQQPGSYVIAGRALGYPIETIVYEVTRRPLLRPLKATPQGERKFTKEGRLYAYQRDRDEAAADYQRRIIETMLAAPFQHFARLEVARLDQDLEECRQEIWQQQLAIREAQRSGAWYRNPGTCFSPMPCDYLPICQSRDLTTSTPAGFVRHEDVHPELGDAPSEG